MNRDVIIEKEKYTAANERFHTNGGVCPPEPLWTPRLREAATTLVAMRGRHSSETTISRKM